ncbi:RNase H domain-containing protein [Caerostris extrusa]|uniref:RNase H domain-containing protein n=1 Tax=Caerostris extrusa TaxID=172846 RepID=A0AAV4WKE8_CAEEX|nr:RNase H domain-containing protein [Caerostris extrusa]
MHQFLFKRKTVRAHVRIPPVTLTLRFLIRLYHLWYLQQDIEIDHQLFKFEKLEERPNFESPWNKSKFEWRYMKQRKEGCYMYTDGSKMNGREQYHETRRLSEEASVFMAELKTIETAIEYVTSNHFSYAKIIRDSRSTKEHVGVARNELADSYAKQATLKEDIDFHLNSTFKSIKKAAHNAIKIAWQQQWTTSVKGRAVHMLCPKVNRLHGNYFINQIITGHGAIAIYQHKFFSSSQVCNCGKEVEDRDHIIFKCELWKEIRGKYFP